jgi:replicative DNA helicase
MSVLGAALLDPDTMALLAGEESEHLFYFATHRTLHRSFLRLWKAGKPLDALVVSEDLKKHRELDQIGGLAYLRTLMETGAAAPDIQPHLTLLREKHAMREVIRIGEGMMKAALADKHTPTQIVDRALTRLTSVIVRVQPGQTMNTRKEFVAHELDRMDRKPDSGAPLPYAKLAQFTGDLIPGDAVAIPGYSNSGKTLFVSNLARHWAIKQVPAIWFPTESQEKFLGRVAASHARIPQKFPERDAWHEATPEQRESFEFALRDLEHCPWDIVPQRRISVEEIIAQTTVRRRQYDGLPVVVVVDHMHRLNYGGVNPAFAVPEATQRLRDWAGEDRHGGIILVLLYQPKKPDIDINVYKPVTGYGISGSGLTMAELDIILSPYRRWVKVSPEAEANPLHRTAWGTPRCLFKNGHPEFAKPESEGAKVDDEHVYVKISKRRTGGEGPTVMLNIDAPSGYIYQLEAHDEDGGLRVHG